MVALHPLAGYPDGRGFSIGHQGVDIPAPAGTQVRAMGAGLVTGAGPDGLTPYNMDWSESGGGNLVAIRHRAGNREVVTQYAHLATINVRAGDKVPAGAVVGTVGSTGNSTGNHLHLGVRIGGVWRHYRELLTMAEVLTADGAGGPIGYTGGPPQPPPDPQIGAYPLDKGRSCAAGYQLATVNPRLHGAIPGSIWWNRPTQPDGTVIACVRSGLQPGDNVAEADAERRLTEAFDVFGDTARNFGLFALFGVILILGLWVLVRGR